MTMGASRAQIGLIYALARQIGEGHPHIKDRAARQFDIGSMTELTDDQARRLIQQYQALINPPAPVAAAGRFNFGGLPKRVAKPAAWAPAKPVTPSAASVAPATAPPSPVKKPVHNFAPSLKVARGGGIEEIPW